MHEEDRVADRRGHFCHDGADAVVTVTVGAGGNC